MVSGKCAIFASREAPTVNDFLLSTIFSFRHIFLNNRLCFTGDLLFKKGSEYILSPDEMATADTSEDCDEIQTRAKVNGIPYKFQAATRNSTDYKLNQLYLDIYDGPSPYNSDLRIFHAQLCRTPAPTEADLQMLREKAASILTQMGLGD